jgi:translation initiation factor IF-1
VGSEPAVRVQATIKEALPNALFQVEMENGRRVLAHVAESFRMHVVRLLPGEEVTLELSPHDGRRGRIVSRAGPASRAAAPSRRKESES